MCGCRVAGVDVEQLWECGGIGRVLGVEMCADWDVTLGLSTLLEHCATHTLVFLFNKYKRMP
jgi:hypothetical protein